MDGATIGTEHGSQAYRKEKDGEEGLEEQKSSLS